MIIFMKKSYIEIIDNIIKIKIKKFSKNREK